MPIAPVRRTVVPASSASSSPTLRQGAQGSAVVKLQQALAAAGFSPGSADGKFGAGTRSAVIRFQQSQGLRADGVAGPDTWAKLRAPTTTPTAPSSSSSALRTRILDTARAELGTRESGKNRGAIQKYQQFFGRGAEAWCADFVSWVSTKSGKALNNPYTPSLENQLKAHGQWKGKSNPQPGDIVMFDMNHDGTTDHTGFVERVNANGTITTIEGNTTNPTGPGEGVFRRVRSMSVIRGFANP